MSEQWPQYGSPESDSESDNAGSSSSNGANPEEAAGAPDVAVEGTVATLEAAVAAEEEAAQEATGESGPPIELIGETPTVAADDATSTSDDATSTAEGAIAMPDDAVAASTEPAEIDEGTVFLTELVRAMQTTAGLERVRTDGETERRRQAHIDEIRAREASEADRMRELAAEDMSAIEEWADGETKRIQLERERRAAELNKDLETSLSEHHAKIDREIDTVETTIAGYRAEVAAFFDGLDRETDPILIAQHAAGRPVFPGLEAAPATVDASPPPAAEGDTASAGPGTPAEPVAVGVMDPQAAAEPVESWAAPGDGSPVPTEPPELVTVPSGSSQEGSESLLQSVPIHRPMSWLRRDANGGDRSNHDG
jgi:hypothetical protein